MCDVVLMKFTRGGRGTDVKIKIGIFHLRQYVSGADFCLSELEKKHE